MYLIPWFSFLGIFGVIVSWFWRSTNWFKLVGIVRSHLFTLKSSLGTKKFCSRVDPYLLLKFLEVLLEFRVDTSLGGVDTCLLSLSTRVDTSLGRVDPCLLLNLRVASSNLVLTPVWEVSTPCPLHTLVSQLFFLKGWHLCPKGWHLCIIFKFLDWFGPYFLGIFDLFFSFGFGDFVLLLPCYYK